jgi:hypothetical protein
MEEERINDIGSLFETITANNAVEGNVVQENQQEVQLSEISPIEEYFRGLGFDSGLIAYGDTEVHIDTLSPEEQLDVLIQAGRDNSVENLLDSTELELINFARENNLSLSDLVAQIVDERVSEVVGNYNLKQYDDVKNIDINQLSNEQIIYQDVINKLGEDVSEEEIDKEYELELDRINSSGNKDKILNNLRGKLQKEQTQYLSEQNAIQQQQINQEIEQARIQIVNAVSDIQSIAGFEVDDDAKNEILGLMVEPHPESSEGLPILIEEYWRNPQVAYEAEWSRRMLPEVVNYYENQIKELKNEMGKQKSQAKQEILQGFPTTKKHETVVKNNNSTNKQKTDHISSIWG